MSDGAGGGPAGAGPLPAFGTAGVRGPLGDGPGCVNAGVSRRVAAAVARVLLARVPGAATRGVVVARDARHGSVELAAAAVAAVAGEGVDVHVVDGPCPTPLAAFALRHLGAAGALVVTASHNPATDNGIKVFWADGAQIAPPVDAWVTDELRRGAGPGPGTVPGTVHHLGAPADGGPLVRGYVADALALVPAPPDPPVPLALTALHGVGAGLAEEVLAAAGHGPLHQVGRQREPDPDFPTVAFPNPEEPGALDELVATAARAGTVAGLALDPDADRLAVVVPDRSGRWVPLTGDQVGALLCGHLLSLTDGTPDRLVTSTVVSSRLVGRMCAAAGVHHVETLTGFKWLCRPALEHPGWTQVLAYEEALGYAAGPRARDKDGITAALVAADLLAGLHAAGRTVWDVLDDLGRAHGEHVTANGSHRADAAAAGAATAPSAGAWDERLGELVVRLDAVPPRSLGGRPVVRSDRPAPDVFRWWLDDDTRVVLRPSGTEPKVKHYCEAVEPVGSAPDTPGAARARAAERLGPVLADVGRLVAGAGLSP